MRFRPARFSNFHARFSKIAIGYQLSEIRLFVIGFIVEFEKKF